MKTSVIEVHDLLAALSVRAVEARIADVPGVQSVTVNFAAKNATVRYDEARLDVAEIKAAASHPRHHRERGAHDGEHTTPSKAAAVPSPPASEVSAADAPQPVSRDVAPPTTLKPAKVDPPATPPLETESRKAAADPSTPHAVGPAEGGVPAASLPTSHATQPATERAPPTTPPSAGAEKADAGPGTNPSPTTPPPAAQSVEPAKAGSPTSHDHGGAKAKANQPEMATDMAHDMGHAGKDLPAMVRDIRNRFFICLLFTLPIFVYAPMGGLFKPPAPPFGLKLNLWLFFFASAAVLYPSWPFFVSAWRGLRKRTLGM